MCEGRGRREVRDERVVFASTVRESRREKIIQRARRKERLVSGRKKQDNERTSK